LNLPGDFDMDLTYRYVSAVTNQKIPAYHTGDARLTRTLGRDFELSVVGQNLFQPHHPEYGGAPGAIVEIRRSAYLKVSWKR